MERDSILFGGKLKGDIFLAKDLYNYVIIQLCIYIALNEYKFLMESESKKYYWFIGFFIRKGDYICHKVTIKRAWISR